MIELAVGVVSDAYDALVDDLEDERPAWAPDEEWSAATVGALLGIVEAIAARYMSPEQQKLLEEARTMAKAVTVELAAATDRAIQKTQN